ncbi:P-loop containing nucleoside triphosphate hydrolase protein [Melanogaster broomeanus]|nr:P-loop containing nucleoside triphosphate hydrolase protein [Melanogaster broomeanus]
MDYPLISSLSTLSATQKASLAKVLRTYPTSFWTTASDISRACRIAPQEANKIITAICRECNQPLRPLRESLWLGNEKFQTGDAELDSILGGGIRTGMVWEVVGESAAGKTQLALQLSLFVQLPSELGGVSGSACYITIASHLQTTRMEQIINAHPLLSPSSCSFSDVQTVQTSTIEKLIYVLSTFLPRYIDAASKDPSSKPLKLLVIDALAELFHSLGKTTTKTLIERSRRISEISTLLHVLASKYRIAVLVLNEVIDVIDREPHTGGPEVSYRDQSRWFGRPDSISGEDRKEAALGLVWANQVNTRIFLTRTGRRRHVEEGETPNKRSITQDGNATAHLPVMPVDDQTVLIRRLSVVFSSASSPASCDYIVAEKGIYVIPGSTISSATSHPTSMNSSFTSGPVLPGIQNEFTTSSAVAKGKQKVQVALLDAGCAADIFATVNRPPTPENELEPAYDDDEWDAFWAQHSLPDDAYNQIDPPNLPSVTNDTCSLETSHGGMESISNQ